MKGPWHIWLVGLVTLIWHGLGAYDYLMSVTRDAGYLAMLPDAKRGDMLAYLDAMPVWAITTWAIGVWFAVAGSLLILLRSRFAGSALGIGLLGFVATQVYTYGLAPKSTVTGPDLPTLALTAAIGLVLLGTLIYARAQARAHVLR
jgi:hypothetical protein